uniref:UMOD/GP2/OIT3-like D8C domain-containing protein n=1 Tax=Denticeps clupeoides TaxID=299321 RepID=A0AAY3ZTW6_9TELE
CPSGHFTLLYFTLLRRHFYPKATNYTVPHSQDPRCDKDLNWDGWYRLWYSGMSVQMPETCVNSGCGTETPLWLNGPHPTVDEGEVTQKVCGHYKEDCCYFDKISLLVKACPGNYYIYKFASTPACSFAYCAGIYLLKKCFY